MKLKSILNPDLVFINETLTDYDQVLKFLSEKFAGIVKLDHNFILEKLVNREKLSSTFLGKNTALPHEKFDDFDNIIIAFIKLADPITITVNDTPQILKYVFSVLATRDNPQLYLIVLQTISSLILNNYEILEESQNRDEFFKKIDQLNFYIGDFLNAGFFTHKHPVINEEQLLSDAMDMMKEHQTAFLPVIDKNQKLSGTLEISDILVNCFPEYALRFDDFSFLDEFEPLQTIWKGEYSFKVIDHMRKPLYLIVHESTSYIEVLFLMAKYRQRYIVVVDTDEHVVGVITHNDVLNKLLRP